MISKLPYKYMEKWKALAFEIQEKRTCRVRFKDLVAIVGEETTCFLTYTRISGSLQLTQQ